MLGILFWLAVKAVALAMSLVLSAAVLVLTLRKMLGYFTYRIGPNRVGPWGILQPIADVVKMLFKEDIIPRDADNIVFRLAPIIALFTALAIWAVIPWGPSDKLAAYMSDPNAGILVFLALGSLSVYGVALGGWASQSKYSLLGSMRATAQMISYELAMGMSLVGLLLMAGTTRLSGIVAAQGTGHYYFWITQVVGFVVFFISTLAEASWTPFDLPEAEAELVGGYNTEYAGMRFGMFFFTELIHAVTMAAMISLLYLGGWNTVSFLSFIPGTLAFIMKIMFVLFIYLWLRATLPRFRYDRLMNFGWKVMLPLAALNLVGTAVYVALWAPKA
ncbi:MAG TPA: NADH-quinone oxidoreductase subunit NuoH [Symbiobacteriaceae bacterium]|jgi:NADH-quinone oxidoreductase subunit H